MKSGRAASSFEFTQLPSAESRPLTLPRYRPSLSDQERASRAGEVEACWKIYGRAVEARAVCSLAPARPHHSHLTLSAAALCPLPLGLPGQTCARPGQTCARPAQPAPGVQLLLGARHVSVRRHLALPGPRPKTRWPRSTPGAPPALPSRTCARASHTTRLTHRFRTSSPPCPTLAPLAPLRALTPLAPSCAGARNLLFADDSPVWRGGRDMTREYCPVVKTHLGPRVC